MRKDVAMPILILILSLLSLLPIGSFAGSVDSWQLVDETFAKNSLCEAIVDGDKQTIDRKTCSIFGCEQWSYRVLTECGLNEEGIPEAVLSFEKKGEIFFTQKISEVDWLRVNKNFLRMLAKADESFGMVFELLSVTSESDNVLKALFQVKKGATVVKRGYWLIGSGPYIKQVIEKHQEVNSIVSETVTEKIR